MKYTAVMGIGMIAVVCGLAILFMLSPAQVGPLGILALFACGYVAAACFLYVGLLALRRWGQRFLPMRYRLALEAVPRVKLYYYASVIALLPIIQLGMQSIGDVGLLEVALVGMFGLIALFYIHKRF
ncbi:MAG: hypothetical protein Q4A37_02795 [Candidatus Saccharibacteria bacterium]|nr:hypothetical protein [Candidatus Saccharibacteria bacterium]